MIEYSLRFIDCFLLQSIVLKDFTYELNKYVAWKCNIIDSIDKNSIVATIIILLSSHLSQKREKKMRLIDLLGLFHLARVEDRTQCLGCKLLRGAIDIDATKKDIHKFCS